MLKKLSSFYIFNAAGDCNGCSKVTYIDSPTNERPSMVVYVGVTGAGAIAAVLAAVVSSFKVKCRASFPIKIMFQWHIKIIMKLYKYYIYIVTILSVSTF